MKDDDKRLRKALEKARTALRIIQTWATFEYPGYPAGHALNHVHVAELCKKTLEETDES